MARVYISGSGAHQYTRGESGFEVAADNVRRLILELERRYPGFGRHVEDSMAVAIDGEICQDTYLEPIGRDAEVYLIPRIAGG